MSEKLFQKFADENQEVQRQIGCMSGIFRVFDRYHLLTGRRLNGHSSRSLPSGHTPLYSSNLGADHSACSPRNVLEKKLRKSFSMESLKTSLSSSSNSSYSSSDCNKSTQQEPSSAEGSFHAERSIKNLPKLKNYESDTKPIHYEPDINPENAPVQSGHQSLDSRHAVTGTIHKNAHALSVKTLIKEEMKHSLSEQKDSPKSIRLLKSADLSESFQVPDKLKRTPQYFSEAYEAPRRSYETKDSSHPVSKGSPRFSLDGRKSRSFLDSQESNVSSSNLRDRLRLSLDSREGSLRSSNYDSKQNLILQNLDHSIMSRRVSTDSNHQQEIGYCKHPSGVVANLMGLETMPNLNKEQVDLADTCSNKNFSACNRQKNGSNITSDTNTISKSSTKEPVSLQLNDHDPMQAMMFGYREAHVKQQPGSVFKEIEQRLKDLEFRKSNKDLRALKHIMDAMHAKGDSESKKGGQPSRTSVCNHNLRTVDAGNKQITIHPVPKTQRALESPIVIMKPAKYLSRSGFSAASVMPLEQLAALRRLRKRDPIEKKNSLISVKMSKERSLKDSFRKPICQPLSPQDPTRENKGCSRKTSNSLSPRMQKKMLVTEKQSHLPILSSEAKMFQKQPSESVSPRSRLRRKPARTQHSDDQVDGNSSEARSSSHQGDDISLRSDSNISLTSQDTCGPSCRSANSASSALKHMKYSCSSNEGVSAMALERVSAEQPSPISVLDASVYQDDFSLSPVKRSSNDFRDEGSPTSVRCCSSRSKPDIPSDKFKSRFSHKKLENIDRLVQKLRLLSSNDDGAPETDHISSLGKTQCPDHRYVSEILLASGILMKNLTSGPMPIQLHPSEHPINPELFFVLEQTKSVGLAKPERINKSAHQLKTDTEKLHRKLLFDLVNELMIQKLNLSSPGPYLHLMPQETIAKRPSGQCLLRELFADIEQLRAESSFNGSCNNATNPMSSDEKLQKLQRCMGFNEELPAIMLDIERSIFRDLIEDLIYDVHQREAAYGLQDKTNRLRRQLFAKSADFNNL